VVARLPVAVVSMVVIGWLGVMERDARLYARGTEAAQHAREDAQRFAHSEGSFRGARMLNPDTTPDLGRAFLYQGTGRTRQATVLLEDVVQREPDNVAAWGLLYAFTRDGDPTISRRAQRALRRLDPVGASHR
jgi:cytochrome c-type biogenesis protein CcmH/NrfG